MPDPQAEKPRRVQLSRAKGWRMPPNTVKVDRTTKWGNPFKIGATNPYGTVTKDARHAWQIYLGFAPQNEKLVAKLPELVPTVDILLGNLEDGVPATDKDAARAGLVDVGKNVDMGTTQLWTRINSLDSPWCLDDLTTLVGEIGDKLDVIMIPKVEGPEDIHYVDRLLAQLEAKGEFGEDTPLLRQLKGLILRGELRDAAALRGVDHARHRHGGRQVGHKQLLDARRDRVEVAHGLGVVQVHARAFHDLAVRAARAREEVEDVMPRVLAGEVELHAVARVHQRAGAEPLAEGRREHSVPAGLCSMTRARA